MSSGLAAGTLRGHHASRGEWLGIVLVLLWCGAANVFGSIVAFTAYVWLLQNVRPALAGSYAYVR
ncbi:hypothetical protein NB693_22910 [Pantoea ananatis]|uniref:hypothetical protein n=1 Tax=Pantoea ananas TaxID=553 RepID=UPI00221FDC95|nr:hypothetical protein [Pantoea ananatis]